MPEGVLENILEGMREGKGQVRRGPVGVTGGGRLHNITYAT